MTEPRSVYEFLWFPNAPTPAHEEENEGDESDDGDDDSEASEDSGSSEGRRQNGGKVIKTTSADLSAILAGQDW